jgi:hypothetical protein
LDSRIHGRLIQPFVLFGLAGATKERIHLQKILVSGISRGSEAEAIAGKVCSSPVVSYRPHPREFSRELLFIKDVCELLNSIIVAHVAS